MDRRTRKKEKEKAAAVAKYAPWVVLDRIPRLVAITAKSHSGEQPYDLAFDFYDPPRPSLCKLLRALFQGVPNLRITAVDHTGCFLVSITEAGDQRQAGATAAPNERPRFLFCDGTAGTARFLPIAPVTLHRANVGLLASAAGHHVVAGLHQAEGAGAIFYCKPGDNTWDHMAVDYPLGGLPPWKATKVICHLTRIYWVDPALGILSYDPFVESSKLVYVPQPPGSLAHAASEGSRHVQLCRGKIRLVQLEGAGESTIIKVWTLSDDNSARQLHWRPAFEIPILQLKQNELRGRIQTEVPKIICMHLDTPTVVFLSLDQFVFEVNLVLGGTEVHQRIPWYDQETGVVPVKFNMMPWTVIFSQAHALPPTSRFPATALDSNKGKAPQPSILHFVTDLGKLYATTSCYISAVDSKSGCLLIYEQHERKARAKKWTFGSYHILHSDDRIQKLPTLAGMAEWHHNNAGIIVNPSTGDTFVGLLHPSHQTMNFWTSDRPNTWKTISISADIPNGYSWAGHGAHALDDALYWVDLRLGFLACNPFTERRNGLKYISLPEGSLLPEDDVKFPLNRVRYINVSLGSIRFVELTLTNGFPFIKFWTFINDAPDWKLEYTIDFSKLNKKMSSLGFINPWNTSKIYFLHDQKVFSVDSNENIQEECYFKVPRPSNEYKASRLHSCNVPIKSLEHFPAYLAPADA